MLRIGEMKLAAMLLLLGVAIAAGLSGCSTHMAFTYPLNPPIKRVREEPIEARIAVVPTKDLRPAKNRSATMSLFWLPLMPFGWVDYHRPEASRGFNSISAFDMNMPNDVAQAIAFHWREAGVSDQVFFDHGGLVHTADYVLISSMRESRYHGKMITYGLSFLGPILWYVGLPSGQSKMQLSLQLELRDRNGRVVWRDTIREEWSAYQGLYYNQGRDMEGMAITLQNGLDKSLRNNPPPLGRWRPPRPPKPPHEQKLEIEAGASGGS